MRIGRATPLNLAPTWDSNPFFFNQLRLSRPAAPWFEGALRPSEASGVLHGNITASLTLLTLVIVSMVVVVAGHHRSGDECDMQVQCASMLWSSAYFLLIGVAFMFVEISSDSTHVAVSRAPDIQSRNCAVQHNPGHRGRQPGFRRADAAVHRSRSAGWPWLLAGLPRTCCRLWWGKLLDRQRRPARSLCARRFAWLTVVPAGVLMGFMFPTGMRLCARIDSRITPWLWAVNGAAGVLASGLVVLVSIETSLNHSLWFGAAAVCAVGRRRRRNCSNWGRLFDPELLDAVAQGAEAHAEQLRGRGLVVAGFLERFDDGIALDVFELGSQAPPEPRFLAGSTGTGVVISPAGRTAARNLMCSGVIRPSVHSVNARSRMFSNSRTFPGNG